MLASDLETSMKIDGKCHCGAISYEAEINPNYVIICHCTDCQTISGGPYRANAPVTFEKFQLVGTPKIYVKTAESGNRMAIAFCGECGSALYSHRETNPPFLNLRLGAVKQRAELPPKAQYFCRSAMPWVFGLDAIPKSQDSTLARSD
jgi:hypothetical protein